MAAREMDEIVVIGNDEAGNFELTKIIFKFAGIFKTGERLRRFSNSNWDYSDSCRVALRRLVWFWCNGSRACPGDE